MSLFLLTHLPHLETKICPFPLLLIVLVPLVITSPIYKQSPSFHCRLTVQVLFPADMVLISEVRGNTSMPILEEFKLPTVHELPSASCSPKSLDVAFVFQPPGYPKQAYFDGETWPPIFKPELVRYFFCHSHFFSQRPNKLIHHSVQSNMNKAVQTSKMQQQIRH